MYQSVTDTHISGTCVGQSVHSLTSDLGDSLGFYWGAMISCGISTFGRKFPIHVKEHKAANEHGDHEAIIAGTKQRHMEPKLAMDKNRGKKTIIQYWSGWK